MLDQDCSTRCSTECSTTTFFVAIAGFCKEGKLDESQHNFYALELTFQHFFSSPENAIFKLVIVHAKQICTSKSIKYAICESVNGDPGDVLCQAVDKYHASLLVVGSHGYGAIKRLVLGSVSDYCVHHAHCSVMIVKRPNDTQSDLGSAVLSQDLERCERLIKAFQAGIVWVICLQPYFAQAPWGGKKRSGSGRELGEGGLDNYLNVEQVTQYYPQGYHGVDKEDKTRSICTRCGSITYENPKMVVNLVLEDKDCFEGQGLIQTSTNKSFMFSWSLFMFSSLSFVLEDKCTHFGYGPNKPL